MEQRIVEIQTPRRRSGSDMRLRFCTSEATDSWEWISIRQLNGVGWRIVQLLMNEGFALIEDTVAPERPL